MIVWFLLTMHGLAFVNINSLVKEVQWEYIKVLLLISEYVLT